jgi:hypothetical protein
LMDTILQKGNGTQTRFFNSGWKPRMKPSWKPSMYTTQLKAGSKTEYDITHVKKQLFKWKFHLQFFLFIWNFVNTNVFVIYTIAFLDSQVQHLSAFKLFVHYIYMLITWNLGSQLLHTTVKQMMEKKQNLSKLSSILMKILNDIAYNLNWILIWLNSIQILKLKSIQFNWVDSWFKFHAMSFNTLVPWPIQH